MTRKFVLQFSRAPGDTLMMTGLVRDLKLTYGDRYLIDVRTKFPGIWRHNPHLTKLDAAAKDVKVLRLDEGVQAADCRGIAWSREGGSGGPKRHYTTVFHRAFTERTKIDVPVLFPRPDLHLSDEEKSNPYISGHYWIIVPGGKTDMTNKWWPTHRYQEVVDALRPHGLQFVQEGSLKPLHFHPPLAGVLSAVGRTSVRDLIVNIYHAQGVICGVTFPMHIAGGLEKPCVVLMGGREEPWYEAYNDDWDAFGPQAAKTKTPHRMLHTLGELDCCRHVGCWRRRVVPLRDGQDDFDKNPCVYPYLEAEKHPTPRCLQMIETQQVVSAVLSYYEEHYLAKPFRVVKSVDVNDVFTAKAPHMPALPTFLRPTEEMATGKAREPLPPTPGAVTIKKKPRQLPAGDTYQSIPTSAVAPTANSAFDHPLIGGCVTICVLLFGQDERLHRRCLNSLQATVPAERMDLHVLCNQVGAASLHMAHNFPGAKVNADSRHRLKYEAMREAFADVQTNWIVWFDDVTYARHPQWLQVLAETIVTQRAEDRVGMLGAKFRHQLTAVGKDPRRWFQNASWFRKKPFRNKLDVESPNGDHILYVNPNFFALSSEAMRRCQIPDSRLRQSGGGVTMGEQLHQQGYQIKQFSADNTFVVNEQPATRRGLRERYPWQ